MKSAFHLEFFMVEFLIIEMHFCCLISLKSVILKLEEECRCLSFTVNKSFFNSSTYYY